MRLHFTAPAAGVAGLLAAAALAVPPVAATAAPAQQATADRADAGPAAARSALPHWQPVPVDTDQGFRGLDAVDRDTAWVTGSAGGVWRTTDGGDTWRDVSPAGAADLMLRDVEAHSARSAVVLAIGPGEDSRIFVTEDGGRTWDQAFVNDEPTAFYNCLDFFPGGQRGLAVSDPVDGKFRILGTRDGGHSWHVLPDRGMPPALDGEFGFSASGTCIEIAGGRDVWIGSGGAASRIFHSTNRGVTWSVTDSTIPATEAGGVFSLAFRNPQQGVAVGGDFLVEDNGVDASAFSRHGEDWTNGGDLHGYRSGVDWVSGHGPRTLVAVGPNGSDLTTDGGRSWRAFDDARYDAVVCTTDGGCWASGPAGTVARLAW